MNEIAIVKKEVKKIKDNKKIYPLWAEKLTRNKEGNIKSNFNNFKTILENDEEFIEKIKYNEFADRPYYKDKALTDTGVTDILMKIEAKYDGINNKKILEDVIEYVAEKNKYNPILSYLNSLKWDGVPRLSTALSDYFGCEQSRYNEYCFRVFLNGAIARVLYPGVKFDYMLTLYGDQGQGKSTFFRHLCGKDEFYQDNLDDFDNKKAYEKTENKWIVEAAEMTYMSKSNMEKIKAYITSRKDTIRYAFKRYSTDVPRKFVLLGTTNNPAFLSDNTGNRRFLIVNVKKINEPKKSIFSNTIQQECDQIMAEAYFKYKAGENFLVMPEEFNEEIIEIQAEHMVDDAKEGMINAYLEERMRKLKEHNKDTWGIKKYYCCTKQLFVEALHYKPTDKISRADSNDIALILQKNPKWIKCDRNGKRINTAIENIYGVQKAYEYNYEEDEFIKRQKENIKKRENDNENINKIMGTENEDYFMKIGEENE